MPTAYTRLSPADRRFLDQLATEPPLGSLPVEQERERMRAGQNTVASAYPVTVQRYDTAACPVHLVRPSAVEGDAPVIFLLHGGGWVLGDIHTHMKFICELAVRSGCVVALIDYPRAPEHPFPHALDSSLQAMTAILETAHLLALDRTRFAFGGDSAGGNLSTALLLRCIQQKLPLPTLHFLLYPAMQPAPSTRSYLEFSSNPNLSRDTMEWFWNQYLQGNTATNDPTIAPLLAADEQLAKFPPTLLVTCEYDVLRDEGEQFAACLIQAGVAVTAVRWLGALHGFLVNEALCASPAAEACMDMVAAYLRRGLTA